MNKSTTVKVPLAMVPVNVPNTAFVKIEPASVPTVEVPKSVKTSSGMYQNAKNGLKLFGVFLISSLIFFLLFLLTKPRMFMNVNENGTLSYNWWKLVLAALVSGLIVLIIVAIAASLMKCK